MQSVKMDAGTAAQKTAEDRSEYDALIERWNHLKPAQRERRADECAGEGHTWIKATLSGTTVYIVCAHCLKRQSSPASDPDPNDMASGPDPFQVWSQHTRDGQHWTLNWRHLPAHPKWGASDQRRYTMQEIATELGTKPGTIYGWMREGFLRDGRPGPGHRTGYSSGFLAEARAIHAWLQLYPRGPLENLRDEMYPEDDEDET
jgi:hypothetical protein